MLILGVKRVRAWLITCKNILYKYQYIFKASTYVLFCPLIQRWEHILMITVLNQISLYRRQAKMRLSQELTPLHKQFPIQDKSYVTEKNSSKP